MMLPLPTVSNIDVTAERLKDVERDAARPLPDLAGGATKALQVGAAAVEMGEQDKARQEAQWFQKEYVDKGWEGAEKLWQETGADPSMNPAYWRSAPNAAPGAYFEMMGRKVAAKEEAEREAKLNETFAATVEGEDPLTAELVRTGGIDRKTGYTQMQVTGRAELAAKSRAELAAAKRNFDSIERALDRAAKRAGSNPNTIKKFRAEMESLRRQADAMDASGDRFVNPSKYTDFLTRARDYERRVNEIMAKMPEVDDEGDDKENDPLGLGI